METNSIPFSKILKKINFQLKRLAKMFRFLPTKKMLKSEYKKIIKSWLGSTIPVFFSKLNELSEIPLMFLIDLAREPSQLLGSDLNKTWLVRKNMSKSPWWTQIFSCWSPFLVFWRIFEDLYSLHSWKIHCK